MRVHADRLHILQVLCRNLLFSGLSYLVEGVFQWLQGWDWLGSASWNFYPTMSPPQFFVEFRTQAATFVFGHPDHHPGPPTSHLATADFFHRVEKTISQALLHAWTMCIGRCHPDRKTASFPT